MGVDSAGFVSGITSMIRYHINLQRARATEFIEIRDPGMSSRLLERAGRGWWDGRYLVKSRGVTPQPGGKVNSGRQIASGEGYSQAGVRNIYM